MLKVGPTDSATRPHITAAMSGHQPCPQPAMEPAFWPVVFCAETGALSVFGELCAGLISRRFVAPPMRYVGTCCELYLGE